MHDLGDLRLDTPEIAGRPAPAEAAGEILKQQAGGRVDEVHVPHAEDAGRTLVGGPGEQVRKAVHRAVEKRAPEGDHLYARRHLEGERPRYHQLLRVEERRVAAPHLEDPRDALDEDDRREREADGQHVAEIPEERGAQRADQDDPVPDRRAPDSPHPIQLDHPSGDHQQHRGERGQRDELESPGEEEDEDRHENGVKKAGQRGPRPGSEAGRGASHAAAHREASPDGGRDVAEAEGGELLVGTAGHPARAARHRGGEQRFGARQEGDGDRVGQ